MKRFSLYPALRLAATALVLAALVAVPALQAAPSAWRLPEYQTVKLDNGLTIFLLERHQLPMVTVHWLLKSGGSVSDPAGKEGVASLTAKLLRKGTASKSALQISETLDFVGASLDADAGLDEASGSCECVAKDLDNLLGLLADLLQHPAFPTNEVEKLVQQEADGIKEEKAVPGSVIGRYYSRFLFNNHPYARASGGTETSLANIQRQDIAAFYNAHYCPNQLLLAVVGDFTASDLQRRLEARFGAWKSKPVTLPTLATPARTSGRRALIVNKPDATQTFFRFGDTGLSLTNRDRVFVDVVNTLFGGRFTSMLNSELRIKSGLTYGANSRFLCHLVPGPFFIGSYTPNDKTERAMELAVGVLETLHHDGLTPEQLTSAKAYIQGLFGLDYETNDQLAGAICGLEHAGLGRDYIDTYFERVEAMTLADARRVIDQYYPLDNLTFVFIGQASVIQPVASKLAKEVVKQEITEPGF